MSHDDDTLSLSYETFRKCTQGADRFELTRRRWGRKAAKRSRAPRGAGVRTTRPLERVEIDHFLVDVHAQIPFADGVFYQRPWLTVAIDHYSGVVLGYHLSLATPTASTVLSVLRHVVLPKGGDHAAALPERVETGTTLFGRPLAERWPCFGIPDCVAVDNGLDLLATSVSAACHAIGTEIMYMPPREPWYKGTIESFGKTTNQKVFHWIDGTTLGKPLRGYDYNPQEHACISLDDLERLIERYVVDVHNRTPRKRKPGVPLQRWLDGIIEYPPRLPESVEAFDVAAALTRSARITQKGIAHENLQYNSAALGQLWNALPEKKTQVLFKVNPLDIRDIFVIDPRNKLPLRVPCTTELAYEPLLDYHIVVCEHAKAQGYDRKNAEDLALAEAHLRREMDEAIARGKSVRRKVRAASYNAAKSRRADTDLHPRAAQRRAAEALDALLAASEEEVE